MTRISVVIGTFGDRDKWGALAERRAAVSATRQSRPAEGVYHCHGDTLHEARNQAAEWAAGEWLAFLDADDELDVGYVEAMAAATEQAGPGDWLLQPATLGVVDGHDDPFPVVIPPKPLIEGNYLIIGTLIRRDQFLRLGGFREWPIYEDWDLMLRAWLDGAEVLTVPEAIYRVHVTPGSRNQADRAVQLQVYGAIRQQHLSAVHQRTLRTA